MNQIQEIPVTVPGGNIPVLIAKDNIPFVWSMIEPRLQIIIDKQEFVDFDAPHVYNLLLLEQAQLWIAGNGEMIMITRIGNYPNGVKRLIVDFIQGTNYKNYKEHMEYIEHWAIQLGATQAEAEIQPGLEKFLIKEQGWKRRRVKIFKHLNKGLH